MTRSASSGSSYGSETPVNAVMVPARALAYMPLRSRASQTSSGVATCTSRKSPVLATVACDLGRHVADASDIQIPVRTGEAEPGRKQPPHLVAVEQRHASLPAFGEGIGDVPRQGGLA